MNSRQVRLMRAINATAAILEDSRFHTPTIKPLRDDLERLAKSLREQMSVQLSASVSLSSGSHGVSRLKSDLRRRHLLPISRRAKLLLKGYPGIAETVRLPHARADVKTHVDAAKRIVKGLRPHANEFIAVGFRKTFLTDCEQAARALTALHTNPDTARSRRSIATRSIPETIREAREVIAVIDAHVNAELRDDRPAMAKWRMAKRVPARMGRPRKPARAVE